MTTTTQQTTETRPVLVWDLPTRSFHWLLVTTFAIAWLTHEDNRYLDVHTFAGYTFLGLLLFRLVWGVIGSHYARFQQFSYSFAEVIAYLKGLFGQDMRRYIGHNPAGAWAIFALIGFGLVLAVSGLFVLGGEERHGLLAGIVSFDQSVIFRETHEITAYALLGLAGFHLLGVISESLLHRENLVGAMFRGSKQADIESPAVRPHRLVAAAILSLFAAYVVATFGGYLTATQDKPYLPFKGPQLAKSQVWQDACGECHLAFHPSLLPARSWEMMLKQQDNHFGEDLFLEKGTIIELLAYAKAYSADHKQTEVAWRMNRSIPITKTPLRITKVDYWVKKHHEINDAVWKRDSIKSRTNCAACHQDAKQGTFEDAGMRIPGDNSFDAITWLRSILDKPSTQQQGVQR
jgi:cytochrome b